MSWGVKYYAQKSVKVGPRGTTEILYTHEVSENKHVLENHERRNSSSKGRVSDDRVKNEKTQSQ